MDRITQNLLNQFQTEHDYQDMGASDIFEYFTNYCITSQYSEEFSLEDVSTGGGQDAGIDGIAIIVNGRLVTTTDAIQELADANSYIDAQFVFIQAKTSSGFACPDIQNFAYGVSKFFEENSTFLFNEELKELRHLQQAIYQNSLLFTQGKPRCSLYFVTTGQWVDDATLLDRIKHVKADLMRLGLFESVTFEPVDASQIQRLFHATRNHVSCTVSFPARTALPPINGVSQAYIGTLPAKEYLKLITSDAGRIRKNLFYDNVRDFQGYTEPNSEMRETLKGNESDQFAVLNNGVTIVAKSLQTLVDSFTISDYQIVNGCQTSHVLFNEKPLPDEVAIPVKIIVTASDEITNAIIRATNTQTPCDPNSCSQSPNTPRSLKPISKRSRATSAFTTKDALDNMQATPML